MKPLNRSLFFSVFFLIYNVLATLLLGSLFAMTGIDALPWLEYLIFYPLVFLLPTALFMYFSGLTPDEIGLTTCPTARQLLCALLLGILLQPVLMVISQLSALIFPDYVSSSIASYTEHSFLLTLISSALFPAIFEELACRGVFLSGFKGRPWLGALLSGLFFAVLHMNLQQGLYAFVFGFTISLPVMYTGCLWLSMLTHFIINGTQLALAFFLTSGIDNVLLWPAAAVGAILSVLILGLMCIKEQ